MKSWRTTLGGILAAVGQFTTPVLPPAYSWVGPALAGIGVLIMGSAARDNKVSTEQARSH